MKIVQSLKIIKKTSDIVKLYKLITSYDGVIKFNCHLGLEKYSENFLLD